MCGCPRDGIVIGSRFNFQVRLGWKGVWTEGSLWFLMESEVRAQGEFHFAADVLEKSIDDGVLSVIPCCFNWCGN